jgi:hypothetical protein
MSNPLVISLLGRRDEPTDAVEEYCRHLAESLISFGFRMQIRRVPWNEHGWKASLQALRLQAQSWSNTWVLVQYTALAWSARGFPRRLLQVLRILRRYDCRIAVVFHDAEPYGGTRWIDRFRRFCQLRVMRGAIEFSETAVLTVRPEKLSWFDQPQERCRFIPVGANLPASLVPEPHENLHQPPCVAVFGITGGAAGDRESRLIAGSLRRAAQTLGKLRLNAFGRNAELREAFLKDALAGVPVEVDVCGVVEGGELGAKFQASDVLLFVRGSISSRRSSAIAGIACGLPLIALEGGETAAPVTEAGVLLVPNDLEQAELESRLGTALVALLSDQDLRAQLVQRSRKAAEVHFAWPAVAGAYAKFLGEAVGTGRA